MTYFKNQVDLSALADEIKKRPIITEYLEPAKHGGYCCIGKDCTNGRGKDATGAGLYKGNTRLHCPVCGGDFTNIDVIAHHLGLGTAGKDFVEVVKHGCQHFGVDADFGATSYYRADGEKFAQPSFSPPTAAQTLSAKAAAIATDDVHKAVGDIETIPQNVLAALGVSMATLKQFHCGYIAHWSSPESRAAALVPDLGYQTAGEGDSAVNVLVVPTIWGAQQCSYIACAMSADGGKQNQWHAPRDVPRLFNSNALTADGVNIIVESVTDALAIAQVTNGAYPVAALGGAGNSSALIQALEDKGLTGGKSKILIVITDDTRVKAANKFVKALAELGVAAAVATFPESIKPQFALAGNVVHVNWMLRWLDGEATLKSCLDDMIRGAQDVLNKAARDLRPMEEKITELIRADIHEAQSKLSKIPDSARRGLSFDTLRHFGCGYLEDWIAPKLRVEEKKVPPTRRLIIPSDNHYLAAALLEDRPKIDKRWHKQHAGTKALFNSAALSADGVNIVVEGEIDAMSIWQATGGTYPVVALGGAADGDLLIQALKDNGLTDDIHCRVLILFDDDDAGHRAAEALSKKLAAIGVIAAVTFIPNDALPDYDDTKRDANAILQKRGNTVLKEIIDNLVTDARPDFDAAAAELAQNRTIEERKARWISSNGEIAPAIEKQLPLDMKYLRELTVDKITASNAQTDETLRAVARCRFYDFCRDSADFFTGNVVRAKKAAKEKIAASSNENPVTAEITALAQISPSKIESGVNSLVTAIKKEHLEYKKRLAAQRRHEAYVAQREAYENNPPTTQQFCSDCPVNLALPYGVAFSADGGISITEMNGPFANKRRAADTAMVPTKIFRDAVTGFTRYEVAIKAAEKENFWRRVTVDGKTLHDARAILELTNYGAGISTLSAKYCTGYFSQIISQNAGRIPEVTVYSQPGWIDRECNEFAYPAAGDDGYIIRGNGFDYDQAYRTVGDRKKWLEMFEQAFRKSTVARLALGASLGSVLVKVLGLPIMQMNMACPSNNGKTALLKLAASIYGDPAELISKFNGTANALEMRAVVNGDLPTFVDEIQTINKAVRASLDHIIYNRESGQTRGRLRRDSTLMETKKFGGVFISTGEQTLTNEASGEGAIKRVVDVKFADIFTNDFAVEVHNFCKENFGHVGREWVEAVAAHKEEIRRVFHDAETSIRGMFPAAFPSHVSFFAMCFTAALTFAEVFDLATGKEGFQRLLFDDVIKLFGDGKFALPQKAASTNDARAIAAVTDFFVAHTNYFRAASDYTDSTPPFANEDRKPFDTYGYIRRNGNYLILPSYLREALKDFPDAAACIRGFSEAGYLVESNSTKKAPSRLYQNPLKFEGKTIWGYEFKREALFGKSSDADSAVEE